MQTAVRSAGVVVLLGVDMLRPGAVFQQYARVAQFIPDQKTKLVHQLVLPAVERHRIRTELVDIHILELLIVAPCHIVRIGGKRIDRIFRNKPVRQNSAQVHALSVQTQFSVFRPEGPESKPLNSHDLPGLIPDPDPVEHRRVARPFPRGRNPDTPRQLRSELRNFAVRKRKFRNDFPALPLKNLPSGRTGRSTCEKAVHRGSFPVLVGRHQNPPAVNLRNKIQIHQSVNPPVKSPPQHRSAVIKPDSDFVRSAPNQLRDIQNNFALRSQISLIGVMVFPRLASVDLNSDFADHVVQNQQHPIPRFPFRKFKTPPVDRRNRQTEIVSLGPERFRNKHLPHRVLPTVPEGPNRLRVPGEADRPLPDPGKRNPPKIPQIWIRSRKIRPER